MRAVEVPRDVAEVGGAGPLPGPGGAVPLPVEEDELWQAGFRILDAEEGVHDLVGVQLLP